jgi:saccharopine dehydrogenase (NAD+, L-lysine-forming)
VTTTPTTPFVTDEDLERERRLQVLADVTCDVTSATNMLPVNQAITTWDEPVRRLHAGDPAGRSAEGAGSGPLDVIAIDNLPSLLPREASEAFSADLTPHLQALADPDAVDGPWLAASATFDKAMATLD